MPMQTPVLDPAIPPRRALLDSIDTGKVRVSELTTSLLVWIIDPG